ncbi:hypothetical protein GRI89_15855 [Altererythrobacter salegens]|uniref:DUF6644 domain-containing protein n=1 Tax=Croceibacterium salegens TaxID=1737568 RepID=A0A6I4T182_9SPHN|nr:DUF6644 family protein [Croceibacterium salegens]MXO61017.1 hypothetical protein [Croceibacterium salegens]
MGEWLFEMTERLRGTQLVEFSLWVTDWPFAIWLQSHFLAIPGFQTLHILAIAVLFSSVLMLNMRIWGFTGKDQGIEAAYRRFVPWSWWAAAFLIATGVVLLISEPVRNMVNAIFWIKMSFLVIAITASLVFQRAVRVQMRAGAAALEATGALKVGAVVLTLLWCAVIMGGRWIAYAPV